MYSFQKIRKVKRQRFLMLFYQRRNQEILSGGGARGAKREVGGEFLEIEGSLHFYNNLDNDHCSCSAYT